MNLIQRQFFLAVLLLSMLIISSKTYAQGNLMQNITINRPEKIMMGKLLENIAHKSNFSFAYNNDNVHADSLLTVAAYNGRLDNLLYKLFGSDYEFKEVPGYIVIRHAPGRLSITADVDKDLYGQTFVKGHVIDAQTNENVNHVSVYEKELLTSTLTDEQGNFELKLKKLSGPLVLTASKDNYRDTSLYLLQDVVINSTIKQKRYKYDPSADQSKGKKRRGLGRLFVSSKQTIQDMNLGGIFQYSPYQLSLTPGLSSHGMFNSQVINHVSINLIGGYTAGIDGVELAAGFNIDRSDVKYFQAANLFNFVGRNFKGVQLAGLYNHVVNNASGFQAAGILNIAHNFRGGVQASTTANIVDSAGGIQITGILNKAKSTAGTQAAIVLNMAKKVKGIQFGLINIADSSDYTIGVVNLIKNGERSVAISTDETSSAHLEFRSGGRTLYGLVGYKFNKISTTNGIDFGIGAHILRAKQFGLDIEFINQNGIRFTDHDFETNSFKIVPTYTFAHHYRLFAGPRLSFTTSPIEDQIKNSGWVLSEHTGSVNKHVWSAGYTFGFQYIW